MHRNDFYNKLEEAIISGLLSQITDRISFYGRPVTYIEVGANDGVTSSKSFEFVNARKWIGAAVEPVPSVFDQLRSSYSVFENVKVVNAAIAEIDGRLPFYQVKGKEDKRDDAWLPMLSSFDKEVILRQRENFPNLENFIEEIEVKSMTLDTLCANYLSTPLDVLLVDAEGFDDKIIRTLNLDVHHPQMIFAEHIHISSSRMRDLDTYLMRHGYQRCILWMDTVWIAGDIITDECVQRIIRSMPAFIPRRDRQHGNGYWLFDYD